MHESTTSCVIGRRRMSRGRNDVSRMTATCVLFVLLSAAVREIQRADGARADLAPKARFALSARDQELDIPRYAEHVSYRATSVDSIQVSYSVPESYPAKRSIDEISSRLENAGWSPAKDRSIDSATNMPRAGRWSQYVDESDGQLRDYFSWRAAWHDAKGNRIEYVISYSRPFRTKGPLSEASITGSWTSAAKAQSDSELAKRARESASERGQ
jgi:hypothetical protein